jgi:energy-coupling factor transporter ATP-binding protein EcfA2
LQFHSRRDFKSLHVGDVLGVELADFMVLTGPNGSGKSNLLESLSQNAIIYDDLGDLSGPAVRLFPLGQLLAAAEGPVQPAGFKEPWANIYNSVQMWKAQAPQMMGNPAVSGQQIAQFVDQQIVGGKLLTEPALHRFKSDLGKPLMEATIQDFQEYAPLIPGVRDPFAASIAEVFLTYAARRLRHEMAQWRAETRGVGSAPSDEEFVSRYGPAPWELLTETLAIVGLEYHFNAPPEDTENVNYEVTLTGAGGDSIKPADLSSGERVLLAIAMGLFTGTSMSESIELPRLLLLDEADASLHPSMVRSLLTVIEEVFVRQYGVRVILATHSPTTVALAPEGALFVMNRSAPRLRKVTTDEAMKLLTVGISSLSVKLENRRQAFVESEYDQAIFQELFGILKGRIGTEKSAEFIAAGRRDVGGGCDMVKRLVKELRAAGSDSVSGIVDRDNRGAAPDHIYYLGDRYSIENLVFDPLLLGSFLLREQVVAAADLGLPEGLRNFEMRAHHAPAVVFAVGTQLGIDLNRTRDVSYLGGFSIAVPEDFLDLQGHALEGRVVDAYPRLYSYKKDLKRQIVKRAVGDLPDFVPQSITSLLGKLLED